MSTPPAGRGGRWNQSQQGAFNNPSRGRGNRQNGRGANMRMQNPGRGRGTNPRGGFNAGRGRGVQNPQQMQPQFQVGGIVRQPQFPGSIPSAPTQQVVMVPNHLLQQAVTPFPFFQQQPNMVATQQGVMQQYQQFVPNPQQAFLIQQQQQQQRQLQLRANQQNANQANQANNRAVPGKPTQNATQPSPPQQAKPPTQMNANPPQNMQTQNQTQAPNQPSPSPIHPMNAQPTQQQPFYVIPNAAYGHQQFMVKGVQQQPTQVMNPMMNPIFVQQQMLLQQQAAQQRARQTAAALQQQQQQQQQNKQGGKDDQQKQTQARNFMPMQATAMYANQQVRMGGPMPPMMAQPGMQQPWAANMAAFQQQQQQTQQQPNRQGAQLQQQQPNSAKANQPSRPPTGITQKNQQEMMQKFAAVATPEVKKPGSPAPNSLPKKGGTPLSAKAAVFVPGSFGGSASSPPPSQPPPAMKKGDPTQQQKVIPPTVVPLTVPGVPAEKPTPAWSKTKASQPPPAAKPSATGVEAEAKVLHMFDPGEIKKVQDANNVGPEEMANLVNERFDPETSDIRANEEPVQEKDVDISSPRSLTLSLGPESETIDDENMTNEEEENKDSTEELDIENRIYTIAQLIKLAKDPDCQELHEVLQNPKYGNIKAHSCVAVHDIIDCTKMNRRRSGKSYQSGGMSRDMFGSKKGKHGKKTPKGKRPNKHNQHHQYPPLLRVEPLQKDMNNSWWATHRQKNSPLEKIRKKSLALLNKLTLENKDTICEQFTNHIVQEVKSTDECNVVVSTIFEKSCAESKFSNLYADLCHVVQSNLSGVQPNLERETNADTVKESEDMKGLFRRSIINLCQLNFNRRLSQDPIEGTDAEIIAQLDNTKRKMMGNIKFIGDLFKHKLIHESIVHHIIAKLLTPRDKDYDSNATSRRKLDDQLEGCCRLLQTVGKQIDVPKAKEWIDQYFDYMVHYQKNSQNRINFMVLEIKELRDNRWVPRREVETVKLKEEVRKEFEREMMEKQRGPKRGKHGVKASAKRAHDNRRRSNDIRGSSSTGNAWGRRTPSSAPPDSIRKKKGSQDIRGFSSIRPSGSASNPPSSAPRMGRAAGPAGINPKVLQKEWEEFGKTKKLDEKKLDSFLKKAQSNVAEQKARWLVFLKHFICNAQAETQKQMMNTMRYFLRKDIVRPDAILQCFKELAPQLEDMSDTFDVPKAAEYYGYLISELVVTNRMTPEDVVQKYCPQKLEKETFHNMYMTGVISELSKIEDPDGTAFIEENASTLAKGFRLQPKDYGNPARRTKIPTSEELPIISVVLGESAV